MAQVNNGNGSSTQAGGTVSAGNVDPYANALIPVPTGQTVLTTMPTQDHSQDAQGAAYAWAANAAYNAFQKQAGRPPTQQELNQLEPSFIGGDKNVGNVQGLNAAISSYVTQQQNTPQNIYNQQQKQYTSQAGQYGDQVDSAFQTSLGRGATDAEKQYYGALMASGQDQYQVQQALAQTQEGQNSANTKFQNQLQDQLQQSNSTYFNQYIAPSLQAQNAMSGQAPGSTALSSQLSNAALQQNQGLQNFLAQTTAQNYQNSTANASNQYNQLLNQQYGLQNAGVSNALNNQASNTAYNQQLNLYQMQQQAYNNYLQNYGKTSGWGSVLQGALGGAAAGSKFGPWGALAGGIGGGALGGAAANSSGGSVKW